jgi:ligand-binding sensor domain-containing protein
MRKFLIILIGLVVCTCNAKAEEKWTAYSSIGGVSSLVFTPDYIWFGTDGGLVRWDVNKKTYQKFTTIDGLGDNRIECLYRDSSGNLWLGGYYAVTKYDGKNFEAFSAEDIFGDRWEDYHGKQIGQELRFRFEGEDKEGSVRFTAGKGTSKFTGNKWVYTDSKGEGWRDSKNRLWRSSWGSGIYMTDSKGTTFYTKENGLPDNYPMGGFLEDSKGNIWIGSRYGGVSRFDGEKWVSFNTTDGLAANWIVSLHEDSQGNIWIGTNKGCCQYDGKTWSTFKEISGFWCWDFVTDESGKLWAITDKGTCWWNGKSWDFLDYHPTDPLPSNWVITTVIDKKENLWFGTGSGVCVYDGIQWQRYPLLRSRVNAILPLDSGEIWVGMMGGVGRFSNGEWVIFTSKDGLASDHVLSVAQDLSGSFWFGTTTGLTRFDGKEWKTYTTSDRLASNSIQSIAIDAEGRLWCASRGISTFDGSKWKSYTYKDGLPDNLITSVAFDSDGILWFASHGGGIGSFDGSQWKRITMEDGLPDNFIYSVTPDDEGRIWVATENGGACVFKGKSWRTFTPENGLASRYVRKVMIDKEGTVWFATGGGVSKLEGLRFH